MSQYTQTTKSKAVAEYKAGVKVSDISSKYKVGQSTLYNWFSEAKVGRRYQLSSTDKLQEVLKLFKDGYSASYVSNTTGVPIATCYTWKHKNKNTNKTEAYSKQFKRNVINSIHDGHSKLEVCKSYNITSVVLGTIIEDHKNGLLDDKPVIVKPAIQTMSIDVLDKFTDVFKLLVGKGLDVDSAVEVSKQLSAKMK